jgi:Tol biopolymer transport system component
LSWLSDGQVLYSKPFTAGSSKSGDVWVISARNAEPRPLAGPWPSKPSATLSPNGHWIAYASETSGRNEIYVRPFPVADVEPVQVSARGGIEPQWRADGKELFFIGADKQLMVVPVTAEREFRAGTASALFVTDLDPDSLGISGRNQYVASASGERFLINQARPGAPSPPVTVLLNWTAALQR